MFATRGTSLAALKVGAVQFVSHCFTFRVDLRL
jgi:hypothetical protein